MKHVFLLLFLLPAAALAQKADTAKTDTLKLWKIGGTGALNFSQVSLTNWSAGGENSLSLGSIVSLFFNYKKDITVWDNSIDLGYGFLKSGSTTFRKSDDKMELSSKWGRKTATKWYYAVLFNFKSQFAPGFNYPNDSVMSSEFLSPGYLLLSTGADYKPNDAFSFFISPLSGKMTIVTNQRLADQGAFGVTGALFDTVGTKLEDGKKIRNQFGALVSIKFKKEIIKNTTLTLKSDFFSDYLDHPENIDVNVDLLLAMKVNSFITASVTATLIYDDDILIPVYENVAGVPTQTGLGPRVQFKEVLAIGLSYKF